MIPTLRPAACSLLKPAHQVLENLQAVLGILGGKGRAFGVGHEAQNETGFIGDSGHGARRTVWVAGILHGRPALFVAVTEDRPLG